MVYIMVHRRVDRPIERRRLVIAYAREHFASKRKRRNSNPASCHTLWGREMGPIFYLQSLMSTICTICCLRSTETYTKKTPLRQQQRQRRRRRQ